MISHIASDTKKYPKGVNSFKNDSNQCINAIFQQIIPLQQKLKTEHLMKKELNIGYIINTKENVTHL